MGNELVRKKHLHGDLKEPGKTRTSHSNAHNEKGKPFKWIKTAEPILDRTGRFWSSYSTGACPGNSLLLEITDQGTSCYERLSAAAMRTIGCGLLSPIQPVF